MANLSFLYLDFEADLYGKEIRVEFNKKIRDEKKFDNIDELKHQIQLDIDGLSDSE